MNWTIITPDDVKTMCHGTIIDKAATAAIGGADPMNEAIDDAVSRVRRAITGSGKDADTAKVPRSLKALTVRMATFRLMERLRMPLSKDQADTKAADNSELLRLSDKRIPVERPDVDAGSGEMVQMGGIEAINTPRRLTGRERTSGL